MKIHRTIARRLTMSSSTNTQEEKAHAGDTLTPIQKTGLRGETRDSEIRCQRPFTPTGCCLSVLNKHWRASICLTCCVCSLKVTDQRCCRKCWIRSGGKKVQTELCATTAVHQMQCRGDYDSRWEFRYTGNIIQSGCSLAVTII